jgi:hypothetical protein
MVDQRAFEARQRWEELGKQLADFPRRRMNAEEIERHQAIIRELLDILPRLKL